MTVSRAVVVASGRLGVAAAVSVTIVFALCGCTEVSHSPGHAAATVSVPKASGGVYKGPLPAFSGPWAAEFAQAYRSTTSSLDHKILATGKITDQDYAAVGSTFVSCVAAQGYAATLGGEVDTFSVQNHGTSRSEVDAQTAAVRVCEGPFQAVAQLDHEILRNPQHVDEDTLVAACLVKNKFVDPGYTAGQYKAESETQKYPFNAESPGVTSCLSNPLGLNLSAPVP